MIHCCIMQLATHNSGLSCERIMFCCCQVLRTRAKIATARSRTSELNNAQCVVRKLPTEV